MDVLDFFLWLLLIGIWLFLIGIAAAPVYACYKDLQFLSQFGEELAQEQRRLHGLYEDLYSIPLTKLHNWKKEGF